MSQQALIRNRLISSISTNFIRQPLIMALSLIGSIVVARVLGPELLAILGAITAITSSILVFADLGITKSIPKIMPDLSVQHGRFAAQQSAQKLLRFKVGITAVCFVVLLILVFSGVWQVGGSALPLTTAAFLIVGFKLFLHAWRDIREQEWVAGLKVKKLASLQIFIAILTPTLTILTAVVWQDPYLVALAATLPAGIQIFLLTRGIGYDLDGSSSINAKQATAALPIKSIIQTYWRYAGSTYLLFIFNRTVFGLPFTLFLLAQFGVEAALLGNTVIAVSIVQRGWDVANVPLASVRVPILARLHAEKDEARFLLIQRLMVIIVIYTSISMGIIVLTLFEPLLGLLYGKQYFLAVSWAIPIATLAVFFNMFSLGNSTIRQVEQYWPIVAGIMMTTIVMATVLFTSVSTLTPSRLPPLAVGAYVLGRGFFWLFTDLWTDYAVFRWQGTELKVRAVAAAGITMLLLYFGTEATTHFLWRGGLAAAGLLTFLLLFRLFGGVGHEARQAIENLVNGRVSNKWLQLL